MSRFVINYFRVSTSQFSSINIFCPDNETIFDMYRLVILKESHKRYIDEAYFKNNDRNEGRKFAKGAGEYRSQDSPDSGHECQQP